MEGETFECVKSFCYLGDTVDGADLLQQLDSEMDG